MTGTGARAFRILEENLIFVSLLAIVVFFGLISDSFLSLTTLSTLFNQLPALTVVSIGMTLVLISGGIDLSVGSVLALSAGVIGAGMSLFGLPLPVAACLGILTGALAGLANGWLGCLPAIADIHCHVGHVGGGQGLGVSRHRFLDGLHRSGSSDVRSAHGE